jgi:hypothetical protein
MRRTGGLVMLLMLVGVLGCEGPPRSAVVDRIQIMTPQMATNLDGQAGPDAVQAIIFFFRSVGDRTETVLGEGSLQLDLYDGRLQAAEIAAHNPIATWTYTSDELMQFRAKEYGLWHYRLVLPWKDITPKRSAVTLVAKYTARNGAVMFSQPVTIPLMQS